MPGTPRGMRPAGTSVDIDRVLRAAAPAGPSAPCQWAWRIPRREDDMASRAAAPGGLPAGCGRPHAGPRVKRGARGGGVNPAARMPGRTMAGACRIDDYLLDGKGPG
jgi:hypothetical protein